MHNTLENWNIIILNWNKDTLRIVCSRLGGRLPLNFRSVYRNFHTNLYLVRIVKWATIQYYPHGFWDIFHATSEINYQDKLILSTFKAILFMLTISTLRYTMSRRNYMFSLSPPLMKNESKNFYCHLFDKLTFSSFTKVFFPFRNKLQNENE